MLSHIDPQKNHLEFAKELRQRQTKAEQIIWKYVRAKRFNGCKFRRQVPIGPFIVDFLCVGAMLIIEIDGNHHRNPAVYEYDLRRTEYLKSWGFRVVRFWNSDVLHNTRQVLAEIESHIPLTRP